MITGKLLELAGGKRSSEPVAQDGNPCGQAAWATTEFGWHYKFLLFFFRSGFASTNPETRVERY